MNRKWWKFLFLLPISVCTLYAGGYTAQFIKNYQEWTSAGNFAGNGTYPQAASLHPLVCFHTALTDFPYNLYGIFLCLVLFGLLTFLLMRMGYDRNGEISDHDRNLNYSTKGTYGTSGFMTPDEMMKVLELTGDVKKSKGTTTRITILETSVIILVIPHCFTAETSLSTFNKISLSFIFSKKFTLTVDSLSSTFCRISAAISSDMTATIYL